MKKNKNTLWIAFFLLLTIKSFSQSLPDESLSIFNQPPQYRPNPLQNLDTFLNWDNDSIQNLSILRVEPLVACVSTPNGRYRLGFEQIRNYVIQPRKIVNSILMKFQTRNKIIPFDVYNQRIELTLFANRFIYWTRDFEFNYREATYQYDPKNSDPWIISLEKTLNNEDLAILERVFSANQPVLLRIKALEGEFRTTFPLGHVQFYKELTQYLRQKTYN